MQVTNHVWLVWEVTEKRVSGKARLEPTMPTECLMSHASHQSFSRANRSRLYPRLRRARCARGARRPLPAGADCSDLARDNHARRRRNQPLLTSTLTPHNLDQAQFNTLRQLLTGTGGSANGIYNVVSGVSAFNVNGGYIALMHDAPLAIGDTRPVGVAFAGGGWGAQSVGAASPAAISVRADNFTATSATGSMSVLNGAPLRLRIV